MHWKLYLAGGLALLLLPTGILLAWALVPYASILGLLGLGLLGGGGVAGLRVLFARGYAARALARQSDYLTIQGGAVVHRDGVLTHGVRWATHQIEAHERIELARAAGALPYAPQITVIDAPPMDAAPAALLPVSSAPPSLEAARAQGLSSSTRWYVGDADGAPQTIDLRALGMVAISGITGSGKSTSAALLAAQAALGGTLLYVCDPHHQKQDSLYRRVQPFAGAVGRFATQPHEINDLIAMLGTIYDRRMQGAGLPEPRILLLIDEFMELINREQLSDASVRTLTTLANGGRGVAMHIAAISQQWGLGSKVYQLRESISYRIIHRSSPVAVRFLLRMASPPDTLAFPRGVALVSGDGEPVRTTIYHLQAADAALAGQHAGRTPRKPYAPSVAPTPAPAQPSAPPTVQAQILAALAGASHPLTHSEIAAVIGADVATVQTEAKALFDARKVARKACKPQRNGEKFEYSPLNQPDPTPT
ncbi:hypothetical protein SE17_21305, partial [Kouleothrix aurantiaca]